MEDKSVKDVLSSSDKTDFIVPAAVLAAGAAGAAVVVVGHVTHSETPVTAKSEGAALIDETGTHSTLDRTKVTEFVDESTAHRKSDEEMITEPAPQTMPSPIHGEIVTEAEVPKLVEFNVSEEAPTVIVSSPTEEPIGQPGRTVEIVKPTPPGEIFSHSVWNESVSPLLQYSLENLPEGIRKRRAPGDSSPQHRPTSSGSDIVSARTHRNIMHTFWQVFFFGWLGGVGRFFGGMFNRKKRGGAATGSS